MEDIHSARKGEFEQFTGSLVENYSRGLVNVIFTVSDYSMISKLRSGIFLKLKNFFNL